MPTTRTTGRDHAVVLGASMAGLLAGRVLAEEYDRVTLLERDPLPAGPDNRRGVPQGRHVHALLSGGARAIEQLFPGILQELAAGGVPVVSDLSAVHFAVGGHRFTQEPLSGDPVYQPSRPYLEHTVRSRLRTAPNVRIVGGCDIVGLTATPGRDRVTGVRMLRRAPGSAEEVVEADLVMDATGRSGRTGVWLEELGYERPGEDTVDVGVRYVSQLLRVPAGALQEATVLVGPVPDRMTGAVLFSVEGGRSVFTVFGYRGHHPPTPWLERLAFAAEALPAHVVAALDAAEPLGEVVAHQFPAGLRRRYERLSRFPRGLLVCGDAVCSLNPIYGQGMSVAALQALALQRVLRSSVEEDRLARAFFRAAAAPVAAAWRMATGSDLSLPEVEGPRTLPVRLGNGFVHRVQRAAERDPLVAQQFFRVTGLLDPPSSLFHPWMLRRVMVGSRMPSTGHVRVLGPSSP